MLPKGSFKKPHLSDSVAGKLTPGSIVMYENDNSSLLAYVSSIGKAKVRLVNFRNREVELPAVRLFPLEHLIPEHLSAQEKVNYLTDLFQKSLAASEQTSIEELWSLTHDEKKDYSCLELARVYLGNPDCEQLIAFRLALLSDKVFFKRKAESFHPREPAIVEQLKSEQAELRRKSEIRERAYNIFYRKISNPDLPIPEDMQTFLNLLEDIAAEVGGLDPNRVREARDFIHNFSEKYKIEIHGSNNERVYYFLRLINHFDQFSNLSLIRHGWELGFSKEEQHAAENLSIESAISDQDREDLTHLDAFTIDDPTTSDMDDAISLEYRENSYCLGVHISDVASLLPAEGILNSCAKRRISSIYLPNRTINMLPEALSEDKFSLLCGQKRAALSYLFEVDRNFEIRNCRIVRSVIKVKQRYNYDDVSSLMDQAAQGVFQILDSIAATHEMKRLENGAIKLQKKEALVNIDEKENLSLTEIDEESPSRNLISELMVLANGYCARFARDNNIPFIYRTQDKPDLEDRSLEPSAGDVLSGKIHLKKSLNLSLAKPHSGLGMDLYCQATSPIRRYLDLINQRQIVSFLKNGSALYSEKEIRQILTNSDEALQRAVLVNRESKRFWLLKYIELYMKDAPIGATVTRTDLKHPMVQLERVYLVNPLKTSATFRNGDYLKVKVSGINPAYDLLRLEPA